MERVWGCSDLSPWFPDAPESTGEVWYSTSESPLLVKFLFTSADLSVQVHPADEYAARHHDSLGKTEMWHILRAEPGARIAVGLDRGVDRNEFLRALKTGTVAELLHYIPVSPGETYFIEAGVVHAIGAGITLCEIQQNSDITYRLYDYGRPRELHIEHGVAVAMLEPYNSRRELPVISPYFETEALAIRSGTRHVAARPEWLIMLEGSAAIGSSIPLRAGEAWQIPPGYELRFDDSSHASALLVRPGVRSQN